MQREDSARALEVRLREMEMDINMGVDPAETHLSGDVTAEAASAAAVKGVSAVVSVDSDAYQVRSRGLPRPVVRRLSGHSLRVRRAQHGLPENVAPLVQAVQASGNHTHIMAAHSAFH